MRILGFSKLELIKSGKRSVVFKGVRKVSVIDTEGESKLEETWWCIRVHLVYRAAEAEIQRWWEVYS